jgi:hypothetical protein
MELPEDVLAIVREYSKPVFKHYKEYNHAIRLFGMKEWKVLKEKLHTEPENVLPSLLIYQDVFTRKKRVYQLRDKLAHERTNERWLEENKIHNMAFYAKRAEEDVFWLFIRVLYGDGQEYWDVREDMFNR